MYTKTFNDFQDNRWSKTDIKVFDFDIKKDIESADISFIFTHTIDPQYKNVHMELVIKYPDGKSYNISLNPQLKDDSGNSYSDCGENYCEVKMNVKQDMKMPAGKYEITLENKYDEDYLPNVNSLGITVESDD
ncbi:hypothetical protein GCM10007424_09830 [Flavobacterium suaedae]|uniref:Gliding motility lipoprotein GldH n=2 Tax=Flavobacterium suaedae TaxID=1767027 RepID=A0ABQ1JM93_9FLAO|nr:hypothetical protein GCM10007424_09830 [Flavobacterium suaedae]